MNNEDKVSILLVEDEALIALSEKNQLENHGYTVHHLTSGEDTVKTVAEESFQIDLILMDIDLGSGMDGTQAAQEILKTKEIPVVFLSSHTEPEIVEKTEKITSYGYVVKNSGIVVLDASIKMALKLFDANRIKFENTAKYKRIYDHVSIAIAQVSLDFHIMQANDAYCKMLGYTEDELIGKHLKDITHPEVIEENLKKQEQLAKGDVEHYHMEKKFIHKDGNVVNGILDANLVRRYDGTPDYFLGSVIDITESRRTEKALAYSEQRLSLATKSAGVGIWDWDIIRDEMLWDDRILQLYGITDKPDQYGLDFWVSCLHSDDMDFAAEECEAALRGDKEYDIEFRVLWPDGTIRWMKADGAVLRDDNGKPVRMLGTNYDITENKKTLEALHESEELFRNIFEMSAVGIANVLPDGRFTNVNRKFSEIVGYSRNELSGMTVADITHPEDVLIEQDYINKVISGEIDFFKIEKRYIHKDGSIIWIELYSNAHRDETGKVLYAIASIIDITELKNTQTQLQTNLDRFSDLVKNLQSGVFYINTDGDILEINNAMLKILGSPSAEVTKQINIFTFPPLVEIGYAGNLKKCIESGKMVHGEAEYTSKWGKKAFVKYYFVPIKENDKIIGVLSNNEDITERKRAEDEIQKQLSEKEILLREVHHRVKNNIAGIESFLMLQKDSTDNPEIKKALKSAISRVQSMRVLYDRLLLSEDLREISIKNYIENLIDSLKAAFSDKENIEIQKQISDFNIAPEKGITVGIIINELLTNVFKYAFPDKDEGKISVSLERSENLVTVIIQDDGIGVDESIMENKSPGFGLTIVKMLSEQLGGTYTVENYKGTRSTLQFQI